MSEVVFTAYSEHFGVEIICASDNWDMHITAKDDRSRLIEREGRSEVSKALHDTMKTLRLDKFQWRPDNVHVHYNPRADMLFVYTGDEIPIGTMPVTEDDDVLALVHGGEYNALGFQIENFQYDWLPKHEDARQPFERVFENRRLTPPVHDHLHTMSSVAAYPTVDMGRMIDPSLSRKTALIGSILQQIGTKGSMTYPFADDVDIPMLADYTYR